MRHIPLRKVGAEFGAAAVTISGWRVSVGMRPVLAMLGIVAALGVMVVDSAEARRGMSVGSRGSRTYQTPPTTQTAPTPAAPIQRSTTPQPASSATPGASAMGQAARPSMFGGGLGGSLMRGLLIGGLVGMLLGHGLGGFAGLLGLLLQGALLALVVMLALRFFRRPQPAPAGATAYGRSAATGPASGLGGMFGGGLGNARPNARPMAGAGAAPAATSAPRVPVDALGITPADLDTFERLLGEVEIAFGREDEAALRGVTTREVWAAMTQEWRDNAARGLRNEISDVKLLQGDLAESWREGAREYATVAMRYASRDVMVDRATGNFVSGDRDGPGESTEVWTFVREGGGLWRLSAMQEAGAGA